MKNQKEKAVYWDGPGAMFRMKILQSVRNFSESQDTRAAKKIAILQKNAILQISEEKFLKIQKVVSR